MEFVSLIATAVLLALVVLSYVEHEQTRLFARRALPLAATVFVVQFYVHLAVQPGKLAKLQSGAAATRAELPLKIQSTINIAVAKIYQQAASAAPSSAGAQSAPRPVDLRNKGAASTVKTAAQALQDYLKNSPDPGVTKAKLITALTASERPKDQARVRELIKDLLESPEDKDKAIGRALEAAFLQKKPSPSELQNYVKVAEQTFSPGWYRDQLLLSLYSKTDRRAFDNYASDLEDRYFAQFIKFGALLLIAVIGFFVGFVVLVVQIGSLSRNDSRALSEEEKPLLPVPLKSAYYALICWQCAVIIIGQGLKLLPPGALKLGESPVAMSVFLLISYLINMVPAILSIYFLALKPNGLAFWQSLKIRWHTASAGPIRLVLSGFLFWCAAISVVVVTALIASQFLGSRGSDNPVLAQIVNASKSPDILAVALLFFTVAVLAPLCEEIIFRGFLYGVLRKHIGTFFALTGSAFIFSVIHLDQGGMPMLFGIGFVLGLCYERTRSLIPCFITHGLWNGGTLLLSMVMFAA